MTGLSHSACVGSTALYGCPPGGGGVLTITGTNFAGPAATISVAPAVCNGAVTVVSVASLTCTLATGTGTTANVVVTTNGGNTATNTGFTILYGTLARSACMLVVPC